MASDKVFSSDITRTHSEANNNLYDLIAVDPVQPLSACTSKQLFCDFVPRTDKYFVPKKKLKLKVKTVRDIRNLFEKEIYDTLSIDLEKQQNLLLRKIRVGSSKDEKTKLLAKNMLQSEKPISRMSWQMLMNINSENHAHTSQFVLWNGKRIQILGSKGGKSKFICKYDLDKPRAALLQKHELKKRKQASKKNLLKHSLNTKFKPGPLSRKRYLDSSYQKYNIGNIELAHIPNPGLEILPEYGKPLEVSVTNFLHNLRDLNGLISEKWAEFAVSTLGTEENGHAVQLNKDNCITFDLNYKYAQSQLLMRRDIDSLDWRQIHNLPLVNKESDNTMDEVKYMLDKMLVAVDISLRQNDIYTGEDSPREINKEDINSNFESQHKDKCKRRGELNRLDVTVIRVNDTEENIKLTKCPKSFCTLGCVCNSIYSSFNLKNHCGNIECMFECKCNFTKYNIHDCFESDMLPGLVNFDKENSLKLAKEEQKFHQTVIVSGEKSILLKTHKRSWKAPEKYADFYSNMSLKTKKKIDRILSIVDIKLNCKNIEPWCMIHNLYKCFCKGKFTERLCLSNEETKINDASNDANIFPHKAPVLEDHKESLNSQTIESTGKRNLRRKTHLDLAKLPFTNSFNDVDNMSPENDTECARAKAYKKRKYEDIYYVNANKRIVELEQNDQGLRKRMMEIMNIDENSITKKHRCDSSNNITIDLSSSPVPPLTNMSVDENEDSTQNPISTNTHDKLSNDFISTQFTSEAERQHHQKLKAWLEKSLKNYRQRYAEGFTKTSLDPPKPGIFAIYPWEFIVNRYEERKNYFLVTKQKPYRIFMVVDCRNTMFNNCIDIRTITDFNVFPVCVRNIVRNEIDNLKDQLCILRGLKICWELAGSVKKVSDSNLINEDYTSELSSYKDSYLVQKSTNYKISSSTVAGEISSPLPETKCEQSRLFDRSNSFEDCISDLPLNIEENPVQICTNYKSANVIGETSLSVPNETNCEQSRWFVMIIENDFSEIQFYIRGFFVKYESIVKAIHVARISEKTVRLSSQKHVEGNSDPQFGIYATPKANQYCVFIGPYEFNEPLGIETIKTKLYGPIKKTRGVWFTTNKADNFRVIDNPLSFLPQVSTDQDQFIDDSSQDEKNKISLEQVGNEIKTNNSKEEKKSKIVKLVKPIKIKTKNVYHLTPEGILKPRVGSAEKQNMVLSKPLVFSKRLSFDIDSSSTITSLRSKSNVNNECGNIDEKVSKRPIAEIAPQVKVSSPNKKKDCGMLILKPEEINNRALVNKIKQCSESYKDPCPLSTGSDCELEKDIDFFLANSVECSAPDKDICVISDDEDYCTTETNINEKLWNDVWIISKSVLNIGWISGRVDTNARLSFEFPGFKFTEFYSKEEAFAKINQVLARKIYVPEQLNLHWSVIEKKEDIEKLKIKKLEQEDLNSEFVLTKKGILHKHNVAERSNTKNKTKGVSVLKSSQVIKKEDKMIESKDRNVPELEICDLLENQGEVFWNEVIKNRSELTDTFSQMTNDRRQQISERLRSILSDTNSH